ncbi:hypothetical protein ES703_112378 [subsurface metagenome]
MAEEKRESEPVKKIKWFSEIVENLPKSEDGSFTDRVIALESAKLATAAGQAAISAISPQHPGKTGLEKGITEGLEEAGKTIITEKLTGQNPISMKVMDVIGDMAATALKEKIEGGGGGGRASEAEIELARRDRAAELEGMFTKFHEEHIAPLAQQVADLTPTKDAGGNLSTNAAVDLVMDAREKAKKLLEDQGFSVESVNVTKAEVKKILDEEQTKFDKRLEGAKEEWEEKSGATVEIEKERIKATADFLKLTTDRLFNIFLEPLKDEIHKAITKRRRGP